MTWIKDVFGTRFDTECTVDIENTFESFHALVELDGNPALRPGDTVKVHGDPVVVAYGDKLTLRRPATVTLADPLTRAWTRLTSDLDCFEMFEVSFTSGRQL